jgi:hypothetical protein
MSQLWSVDTLGGYMYSDQLSSTLRTVLQPLTRFRNFCDVEDAKEKGTGELFNWNIYSDVETQGGALAETDTMPETKFSISQGTLTITEYANSVPYTRKLDLLSKHSCEQVIHKVLKNDASKSLDTGAYTQFARAPVQMAPTGGTSATAVTFTEGVTAITNNVGLSKEHVKAIADEMAERNVTPYDGENYCSLGRPTTFRPFKNDLEELHKYVDAGYARIAAGEIGRYEGIRFFQQTNVPSKSWTNGESDEAFFFGADTVAEAIVEPEQIRAKLPGDFGRSRGMAWMYIGGFGISHLAAANARIFKWSSAA